MVARFLFQMVSTVLFILTHLFTLLFWVLGIPQPDLRQRFIAASLLLTILIVFGIMSTV